MPQRPTPSRSQKRRTTKRVIIVAAVLSAIGVTGGILHLAHSMQRTRMLAEARRDGLAAYERGEYELAVDRLGYFNTRKSDDPETTIALASARANRPDATRDDLAGAATLARRAWELAPDDLRAPHLELRLRARLHQHTERLEAADRLLTRFPDNDEAAMARIESLAALGRRNEAVDAAREYAQQSPDNLDSHRTVLRLLAGFDSDRSRLPMREYAEELVEAHPNKPSFLIIASQAIAQAGGFDRARAVASTLLTQDKITAFDGEALSEAVRLFDALAMRDSTDRLLIALEDRTDLSGEIGVILIQRAYQSGRSDEAREQAEIALDATPEPSADLVLLGILCGLDVSLDSTDGVEPYHTELAAGISALRRANAVDAAQHFELALRDRPSDALALANLAEANDRMGAWVEAQRLREQALRSSPAFSIVRLAQVNAYLDRDQAADAVAAAVMGLQIEPNNGGLALAYSLAVAHSAEQGIANTDEIRTALQVAKQLDGDAAEPATPATPIVARLLIARGMTSQAKTMIDRILAAPPGTMSAPQLLALAESARGAGLDSSNAIIDIVDRDPRVDPFLLLDRAERLAARGQTAEGLAVLNSAIETIEPGAPRLTGLQLARAVFLDRTGSPEALDELRRLSEMLPDDAATQTIVLESSSAWVDEQLVTASIRNLQRLTGDEHSAWRVHEARRLLTFETDGASAAKVVNLLDPLTTRGAVDPTVHLILSDAFRVLGDLDAAVTQLERAADSGLDRPGVHLRLIGLLQSQGNIEAAQRRARILSKLEPVTAQVRRERALTLTSLGLFEAATDDADKLARTGDAMDLVIAAKIAARAGETRVLTDRLDALAQRRDLSPNALGAAGGLFVQANRTADAFALVAAHRPESPDPAFARAEASILLASDQSARAIDLLRNAYAMTNELDDGMLLARVLASTGNYGEAEQVITRATAASPNNEELLLLASAIDVGNPVLASASASASAAGRTIAAIRTHLINSDDTEALIRELRTITADEPTYFPAWAVLASRLAREGRTEEAAETALTAGRLLPEDSRPARLAVEIMLEMEPLTRALTAARDWQRRSRPDTYQADTTTAAIMIRLGRYTDAATLLSNWAERITGDPTTPPVLVRLYASQLASQGRPADARALFENRVRTDARWREHKVEVARDLILFMDSPNAARAWLNEFESDSVSEPGLLIRVAQARSDLAVRTARGDDRVAAAEAAERAMDLAGDDYAEASMLLRIEASRRMGQYRDASSMGQAVVRSFPDSVLARCVLVQVWADASGSAGSAELPGMSAQAALRHAESAKELAARSAYPAQYQAMVLDAMGRALLMTGAPREAEESFRVLMALQPRNPSARLGLAESFRDQGKLEQARRLLFDPQLRDAMDRQPGLAGRFDRVLESLSIAVGGE